MNCIEHADPGLFALSLGSSSPGLQLRDPELDKWVDVPLDLGVIWCGQAAVKASDGAIKPGEHRVLYGTEPRISLWHEVSPYVLTVGESE